MADGLAGSASTRGELLEQGREVIENEATYLDERRWDEWLALYTEQCEYWAPSWKMDGSLTSSPETELSHIYYSNRAGLEERISRLLSRMSPASHPAPRTCHILSNIKLLAVLDKDRIRMGTTWVTHIFFVGPRQSHAFFGRSEFELESTAGKWLIARKKVILQNDYIPSMLDINYL